jgi:glutaminyl-peptide cyclotransferase
MAQTGVLLTNFFIVSVSAILISSCSGSASDKSPEAAKPEPSNSKPVQTPEFNSDSAYQYVKQQVLFGPRVPESKAHEKCADWYISKFKSYGLTVTVQEGVVVNYLGKSLKIKNIQASLHPENKSRIVLFDHWDTRSVADQDTEKPNEPGDGADDGASGAGVLIELARDFQKASPAMGVDLMLLDAEDTGQPDNVAAKERKEDAWCLGTQYWAKHLPTSYLPRFGILLDMVGAKNAQFPMEGHSLHYAEDIVKKVWGAANDLGYSNLFLYEQGGTITDDHYYVNSVAHIPTIDILNWDPKKSEFGFYHHKHSDNMDIIDKTTLKAVGQTLLQVLYTEMP